ncbi:hypothetical protein ACLOJK_016324 [Asimina triloba]
MQAYVTQDDTLMTTLTVTEAVYYSAQLQLPDSMSRQEKRERAETTIKEMGLQDAMNTRIGGGASKGLSGGQKRRVSICIEMLTRPKLLFLDEPTSGLDSAASYHVMNVIVGLARGGGRIVIASIHQPGSEGGAPLEKGSQASFLTQSLVLTRRSFVNMYRDLGYYWLRLAIYVMLCLCVGTVFHDVGHSYESIQARGSLLMFVASFLKFMAIGGGFPSFVEDMKIFEREKLNGHYSVGAYVTGNTLSSIPYLFLIAAVPGAIGYFLAGLQRTADIFLYFTLVLFACTWLVESLMMTVASVVPDFLMGIIAGAGIQGIMMLNGGFFRLP